MDEPRYCKHNKCLTCSRDGVQGLCTYDLLDEENNECGDCLNLKCNPTLDPDSADLRLV